jgi:hypothetical protein
MKLMGLFPHMAAKERISNPKYDFGELASKLDSTTLELR